MARKEKPTFITEQEPFPQRLRELLEKTKTTQNDLANFVGCTRQAISLYATGQSSPDIKVLLKISDYFKVSTDYLLGISDATTSDVNELEILNYTGLSEKAMNTILSLRKHKKYFISFIALLESTHHTDAIFLFLAEFLWDIQKRYESIIDQRNSMKRYIHETLLNDANYDFSQDDRFFKLIADEREEEEIIDFKKWKLFSNLQSIIEEFIDDVVPKPCMLYEDFEAFVKECISDGKHNKEG